MENERALAGLANVSALTFLAGRAIPGGFWIALAGGVPLARAAQQHGLRSGYATAAASIVETTALMGPARLGIPLPHAASAPVMGHLDARGASLLASAAVCAAIRFAYYALAFSFFVLVLVGVDAYRGTYDRVRDVLGFLPEGDAAALGVYAVFLLAWSLGAGLIQAWVLRRGLREWLVPRREAAAESPPVPERGARPHPGVVVVAGLVAAGLVLVTLDPVILGLVLVWLAGVWLLGSAGRRPFIGALALALPLTVSTFGFGLVGGLGMELALRRAARVALLVLVAVWVQAAAGPDGLRDISLRLVRRLRRVPTLSLTAMVLGASAGPRGYAASGRRLLKRVRLTRRRPEAIVDASLRWLAEEAGRAPAPAEPPRGRAWAARDTLLVAAAGLLVLAAGVRFGVM